MGLQGAVEKVSDRLGTRTTRRGFFGLGARLAAGIAAACLGVASLGKEAAAYGYACCNLLYQLCSTCPNCPPGESNPYTWVRCDSSDSCNWACTECYTSGCSCGTDTGQSCGGGICNGYHPQKQQPGSLVAPARP
jgi:hypothetical protein